MHEAVAAVVMYYLIEFTRVSKLIKSVIQKSIIQPQQLNYEIKY